MKPVVLSLGVFPPATMSRLDELFELHHFTVYPLPEGTLSPDLKARIRAIATEANRGATRDLIASLPKLEIISCFGVGVDGIDLAAARERAIPVTNTPGVMADECADLAIGMMLLLIGGVFDLVEIPRRVGTESLLKRRFGFRPVATLVADRYADSDTDLFGDPEAVVGGVAHGCSAMPGRARWRSRPGWVPRRRPARMPRSRWRGRCSARARTSPPRWRSRSPRPTW